MASDEMHEKGARSAGRSMVVLEHLTGPSRGQVTWLAERLLNVVLRPGRLLEVTAEDATDNDGQLVARIQRSEGAFEIEAADGQKMWINGRPRNHATLRHNDTIEFGETGPISRVRIYCDGLEPRADVTEILSDAAAYMQSSRQPLASRFKVVASQVFERIGRQTTLLFRLGVFLALVLLGVLAWQQSRITALLRERIETGTAQLEGFAKLLVQTRQDALTPRDLQELREELSGRMSRTAKRISTLEERSTAVANVIARSRSSILFLQGAYAFRQKATGRMLRHVVGPDGTLLVLPNGVPLLSLAGKGKVAERQFTGTGFVVGDGGMIATSRHVGEPWLYDTNVKALVSNGLEPVPTKFVAYFTDGKDGRDVVLVRSSDTADVALLRLKTPLAGVPGLKLSRRVPRSGEDVVLIGYPAGIRSMVAHAGANFIRELEKDGVTDFWKIAERLSAVHRIIPLASRGIVGRVSQESIVYDAETTYGGSGGPVLDTDGSVVAVNSAIIPEYGGSNFGVPVEALRRLLEERPTN